MTDCLEGQQAAIPNKNHHSLPKPHSIRTTNPATVTVAFIIIITRRSACLQQRRRYFKSGACKHTISSHFNTLLSCLPHKEVLSTTRQLIVRCKFNISITTRSYFSSAVTRVATNVTYFRRIARYLLECLVATGKLSEFRKPGNSGPVETFSQL